MELIAILSSGQGTWGQVSGLVKKGEWSNIFILGPNYAKDFKLDVPFDFIEFNPEMPIAQLKDLFLEKLKDKIPAFSSEVALSIASGSGKEHMAIISALLSIPVGVRFTALTSQGVIFL